MAVILNSERLVLRKLTLADAPFIMELLNTPTWLQFIGDRNIRTVADAQNYLLTGPLMSYALQGFGLYLFELKESRSPAGLCGLLKRDYLEHLDIGYAILPCYEGLGYAHEIAMATVQFAFNVLKQQKVLAITQPQNNRSVKLLNRLGFTFARNIRVEGKSMMLFDLEN